ncbi:ABC transporter ATP-binding protein [Allorhodopirellula solitaria]
MATQNMAARNSVLSLKSVYKRFQQTVALHDVSLDVPSGVVFALLGENGAGKSTLIKILTGYESADYGHASVLGRDCDFESMEIRRKIGYVSDAPALYEWMTPPEIGWFTSAFYPKGFLTRYQQLLAEFNVPAETKIKNLSKGQRAKVALALAIGHDPELLILDEPTSGLDPMVRRQFLESMVDRAAVGRTVLLSSHQISEVERVADWVAILHHGQLKVVAPLEELKTEVQMVTATVDSLGSVVPVPRGEVLTEVHTGRQIRWIVKNLPDDWRDDFPPSAGATKLSAQRATLEEIFIAICDDRATRPVVEDDAALSRPLEALS